MSLTKQMDTSNYICYFINIGYGNLITTLGNILYTSVKSVAIWTFILNLFT
jgi:hypothetical protein